MQIRVAAPEGPSADVHRRSRQCRNWMELLKTGRRMKLNCSVFVLSRSSSRLFRLRSSGLLAPSLWGLLSLFRLALSSPPRLAICLLRESGCDSLLSSFLSIFSSSSSSSCPVLSVDSWLSLWLSLKDGSDGQESLMMDQSL